MPCPGYIITAQPSPVAGTLLNLTLPDGCWETRTQITGGKKKYQKTSPPKFMTPRARHQIPFSQGDSEGVGSITEKSRLRKSTITMRAQLEFSRSAWLAPSLPRIPGKHFEKFRMIKGEAWPTHKVLSFNIACLFSPTKPKREDCLKRTECLLNQLKTHSLLCYSPRLS